MDNNDFAIWLYNRYVEAIRNEDHRRMNVFLDVLNEYVNTAVKLRAMCKQKRYAEKLLKTIYKALKNGTYKKLQLEGKEWKQEFDRKIKDYEKSLIDMGLDEETIQQMVAEKKYNYGND